MTAAVAPNVDLVSWSRLGAEYQQKELDDLIQAGSLVEFRGVLRPSDDIALFRAEMAEWPGAGQLKDWQIYIRDWVTANNACREDILQRLQSEGQAARARAQGHLCGSMAINRVDQQPQRAQAARLHGTTRRGPGVLTREPRARMGPGRAHLCRLPCGVARRGARHSRPTTSRLARHSSLARSSVPGRASRRWGSRSSGRG